MIITNIKVKSNKKTSDVYLESGEVYNFSNDTIVKYGLCKNFQITGTQILELQYESERQKALDKTLIWLNKGFRTEQETILYLKKQQYSSKIIQFVIDKLKEYNFINDENFAKNYVNFAKKNTGIYKIKQKLIQKHIDSKLIDKSLSDLDGQFEACLLLAQKKATHMEINFENKVKLNRYLASNGFTWEIIRKVLNKLEFKDEEEDI